VILFDATYITNKYIMSFTPFIGVNDHFRSRLLGCTLFIDETSNIDSYSIVNSDFNYWVESNLVSSEVTPDNIISRYSFLSQPLPASGTISPSHFTLPSPSKRT